VELGNILGSELEEVPLQIVKAHDLVRIVPVVPATSFQARRLPGKARRATL